MPDMRFLIELIETAQQRPDILFHASQPQNIAQILATDTIQPGSRDGARNDLGRGVSLSRSFDFAATWGRNSTVLILNCKGIETVPCDYWRGEGAKYNRMDEEEEFLPGSLSGVRARLIGIASKKCTTQDVFLADVNRMWDEMPVADRKRHYGANYTAMARYMKSQFQKDRGLWIDDWHRFSKPEVTQ